MKKIMNRLDYTIEYCPWCDQETAIHAIGITACPNCGKPLAPCSVCHADYGCCPNPCRTTAQVLKKMNGKR